MQNTVIDNETHYWLLKKIEANPKISQRELAKELGISLGKVNYCLKALVNVGLVKVGNFVRSNNKSGYAYSLTPAGVKEKTAVTLRFLKYKQKQYEQLRLEIEKLKKEAGTQRVNVRGIE